LDVNKVIAIGIIIGIGIIFAALAGIYSSDDSVSVEENSNDMAEPESTGRNIVIELEDGLSMSSNP